MRENRVRSWMEVVGSVIKVFAEFNEKGDKNFSRATLRSVSRAAIRGRKVAGPAVYKNIAEVNKIRPAQMQLGAQGRLTMKRNRDGVASSPWPGQPGSCRLIPVHQVGEGKLREESRWAL